MITLPSQGNFLYQSKPRSIVKVNGVRVPFMSWKVDLNGYATANTFTVDLPFRVLQTLSGTSDLVNTPTQSSILVTQADVLVEIFVGYPKDASNYNENDLTQLMHGYLDTVDFYFDDQGEHVQIQGRNLVALFMDTKTTDKFPNQTSSAIVTYLAQQQGLTAQVTPTYTLAGTYYSNDHTQMSTDITQWDLMYFLATQEGYTLRVKGSTLYFMPRETMLKSTTVPYTWGQNVKTLQLSRNPHASRDIKVEVFSWDGLKKNRIHATAENTVGFVKRVSGTSGRQAYVETFYHPGLTLDQAQKRAQSILNQLSQTEITGRLTCDGNDQMDVDQPISLHGVGYDLSAIYYPTQVEHSFSAERYDMSISFGNLNLPSNPGGV